MNLILNSFEYEIIHRNGKAYANADAFSRLMLIIGKQRAYVHDKDDKIKSLDNYEDEGLLHFVKYRNYLPGLSK